MGGYRAIEDVGRTLVELLKDRMGTDLIDQDREIALSSPNVTGTDDGARLTLYLYRVAENGHLKNDRRREIDVDRYRGTPLALDLYYLLTAHPSNGGGEGMERTEEQHRVLGRAMQVIHDNSIIRGSDLKGSLSEQSDLQISIYPQAMDDVMSIWNTFDETPFQPSVAYLVTPVLIESTEDEEVSRIVERRLEGYSWRMQVGEDE